MIDISHKRNTLRYARASGKLTTKPEIIDWIKKNKVPKGDVGEIARSAGIQAAKRASDWMVFCHSLPLDWVEVSMTLEEDSVIFTAEVRTVWKTGVEMEAMIAVSAALLNAYDMLKPLQTDITISEIRLEEKTGGKSDWKDSFDHPLKTALLSVDSEKKSGRRADRSVGVIRDFLQDYPVEFIVDEKLEAETDIVRHRLQELIDHGDTELVLLCGSTGPNPDDVTPGLIRELSDREIPGIGEAMRQYGLQRTPHAMISGQVAGLRNKTLMIALPGSSRGAEESLHALFPGLLHIFKVIRKG